MTGVLGLRCVACGREVEERGAVYACGCGGNLDVVYDYAALKRRVSRKSLARDPERSVWRYAALLPAPRPKAHFPPVGWTPLTRARSLGRGLGLPRLYLKDDGRNPSASFKDRAGLVAIAKALSLGRKVITGASTGNAASSLACLSAAAGVKTVVFVPRTAPAAKLTQLLVFGACVVAVDGTYDQAFELCLAASAEYGWYNRNTGHNPYTREGKKTCAYELVEQLGWRVPDVVFVAVGDGNILSGLWKGFKDLRALGLVDRLPRLAAVQAAGSNAVAKAFRGDGVIRPVGGETAADSISVSLPRDGAAAVRALRESRGLAVEVTDAEILAAIPLTARAEGVFAEPAGAAAVAGVKKAAARGLIKESDTVVAVVTGSGLKDVAGARKAVGEPHLVAPDLKELKRLMKKVRL